MSTHAHPSTESRRAAAARAASARRTETGLARVALGLAALHVLDDNFLQPEPGTSAGDHLAGGLVQTAFFVLLAWAYPRMGPGLRGTLALVVGLFVVVMGVGEAGYYTREDGPSGDDYTGLLVIPAGLLLAGVGLVTLWKSRKGGSLVRRYGRRAGLVLGLLLGLYFGLYPLAESYVSTHAARAYVPTPGLGTAYEDVAFTSSDGLRLEGWFVPPKNGATVISFPGRKGTRDPARMLARRGYGVLLFDRRGEGESEGDPNLYGWQGTRDLKGAISYLESRADVDPDRIGAIGLSVGGEMLLQAAAEGDDFDAIVSEGAGIRSVREAVHHPGAVKVIATHVSAIATLGTAVFASDLPPRSLTDLSGEISEPMLVIYSEKGQGGEKLSREYYEAAKGPKELWPAPGGHIDAINAAPEEYERRVIGFFARTLRER